MTIKRFNTGSFMTHTYLVWNEDKKAYLFDCEGTKIENIVKCIEENNLSLEHIVLTHGHSDHICGVNELKETYPNAKVYIGEEDAPFLTSVELNHSDYMFGINFIYNGDIITVKEGDVIGEFKVMDTPGHTKGSKCFYNKESNTLISGDTMFRRAFGRYDLAGGNQGELFASLNRLCELPSETKVFNGHMDSTTIGEEREFLKSLRIVR